MLKFTRRSRSTSADRSNGTPPQPLAPTPVPAPSPSLLSRPRPRFQRDFSPVQSPSATPRLSRRAASLERVPVKSRLATASGEQPQLPPRFASLRQQVPPKGASLPPPPPARRPAPSRPTAAAAAALPPPISSPRTRSKVKETGEAAATSHSFSSGTLCRLAPLTPTLEKLVSPHVTAGAELPPTPPKSVLKRGARYDFHRAVERLVEKLDLQLMDTSSESGYGSEQEGTESLHSVTSGASTSSSSASPSATASSSTSSTSSTAPPPLPKRRGRRRRVQFDSYVMLLQGLKERNLELVQANVKEVCREALSTDEVALELMRCVADGEEPILREMLDNGFDANFADPAGLTPLHLAAAFNLLSVIKMLISRGAAVHARAHSSGHTPSGLCSPGARDYEACKAYLRCMEECLGKANGGAAHVVRGYRTCRGDELCVAPGQCVTVVRRGDYEGSAWWWCGSEGRQGYVLRDLLALKRP